MLHFILGRAGSGKTEYLRSKISEMLLNGEKDLLLLVPEQFSFESERQLLSTVGAEKLLNIDILSFTRIANKALQDTPYFSLPRVTEGGRAVLLSLAVESLGDELTVFKKHKSGYSGLKQLLSFIQETKQCSVTPSDLNEKAALTDGILSLKLTELSKIISAYNSLLSDKYFDDYNLLDIASEYMRQSGFFNGKTVFLDAFTGFTSQEMKLISVIFSQAKEIYITLCTPSFELQQEYSPFSFINKTAHSLISLCEKCSLEIAENTVLECKDETRFSPEIRFIEKNLYSSSADAYPEEPKGVSVYNCDSKLDECRLTAREIKRLMREENCRCRDIAVFQREGGTYDSILNFMFKENAVPFYEDERVLASQTPLVMAVRYALRLAERGFDTDSILGLLKTDMTSLSEDDISLLETYCFIWDIKGKDWKTEWAGNPDGYSDVLTEENEILLKRINSLRETVCKYLNTFISRFKRKNGRDRSEAVYEFLIDIGADKKLKQLAIFLEQQGDSALSLEQERVWSFLMEALNSVAVLTGENEISAKRYNELFEIMISAETLGQVPQGLDNVAVADAQRSRLSSPDYLFVLGLNEGEFPQDNPVQSVITESERHTLIDFGLEILPACDGRFAEERFIVYHALTSARKGLYLLYNSGSVDNGSDAPSEVIDEITRLFPYLKIQSVTEKHDMSSIESEQGAFSALASTWNDETDFSLQMKAYFSNNDAYKGVFKALERAADGKKKETCISDKTLAERLYRKDMNISASRVEEFYSCPFKYFCRFGLKAYPLKRAQVDAALSGTIIHRCLEVLLKEHGRGLFTLSEEERKQEIRKILEEFASENMNSNEGQTARFLYNFNYHVDIVSRLVERLCDEFSNSDFSPVEFEMKIGEDSSVKPYEFDVSDGSKVRISGSIDRVDLMTKDGKSFVRVVDYKSGKKEFHREHIYYGLNCQMLIYLFALWKNGGERFPDFVPSGVLYFRANDKFVNVENYMSDAQKNKKINETKTMSGVVLDDDDVILSMDRTDSGVYIPAKVHGKAGKMTLGEFEFFRSVVEKAVSDMALKLHSGDTAIYPADVKNYTLACNRCDYASVCGIDDYDAHRTEPYEEVSADE